ncbi:Protein GstA [Nymphon striatum]|nr:Protein GstA [Nymphon striatum]
MTIKLHCFGESGNAYKAALALELSGLEWEPVKVDFFGGETRTEDYKTNVNPMGEAPVMIDGDVTLTQSGAIQQYVHRTKAASWAVPPKTNTKCCAGFFGTITSLASQAGMTRFLMNFLPEDKRPQEVIAFSQGRLKAAYTVLNNHLNGRDWMVGDGITNADISCCSYLFYPEPFGFDRADWPHIDAWLTRISETPGWKHPYDLMPGSPADRA